MTRLESAQKTHELAIERLKGELARADERLDGLRGSLQSLQQLLAEQKSAAGSVQERWREAAEERREIEEDAVLRVALELEELDLDRLGDEALSTLDTRARQEQEKAIEGRLAHACDERASLHIEEHGLLPPSQDVQHTLDALRARLGAAWSGWEWVAANAPRHESREMVRQAPDAAQGVVVRPGDLQAALAVLREQGIEPDGPVVLTTSEAFQARLRIPGEVLGPRERAWFDREAASERLQTIRARLDVHRQGIAAAERRQRELNERRARLRTFRSRYPRGWFADTASRLDRAQRLVEETRGRVAETGQAQSGLEARRKEIESEKGVAEAQLSTTTRQIDAARTFVEEHERPSATWRSDLEAARHAKEDAAHDAATWREIAKAAEERAGQQEERARGLGEDAREVEKELRDMAFVATTPAPAPGPLDLLRDHYRQLRLEYETKVGADALRLLAERHEEDARAARQTFLKLLSEDFVEADVQKALASLAEPDRVEEERRAKEEATASLQGKVGNLAGRIIGARKDREEAELRRARLGPVVRLDKVPSEPELIEVEAGRAETEAQKLDGLAAEAQGAATKAEAAVRDAKDRVDALARTRVKLSDLRENFVDLLAHAEPSAGLAMVIEDDAALQRRTGEIERGLRDVRRQWQALDTRSLAAAQEVRAWIARPEHEGIQTVWVRHLSERDDAGFEDGAARLSEQLRLRAEHLEAQIGEADRHRVILVDEVLAVAEEGLKLLRAASNVSRLPDHVPGLGGTHFLRITAEAPEDPEERRGRVGELVDQLAAADRPLAGVALVQAAVRRLARPVQVRVLHPDPALERRTVSIPEMARFSGGEQLTGAILLYCTLARLRARSRGLSRRPSSVLVLDNPIGRVSRPRFLEIQRDVARAMGVQLIYATGVNDYEALRVLPNIIRLRNERVDRNRGHRLVEHDDEAVSLVEAVRVGRDEHGGSAPTEGEA